MNDNKQRNDDRPKSVFWRRCAVVAATAAMTLVVVACGQSNTGASSSAPSSSSQSSSDSASSSSDSSASGGSSSSDISDECTTEQLKGSITSGEGGAAGSQLPYIVLTNTGDTCTMKGYPGVSLTVGGQQIGAAAERDRTVGVNTITLAPNESAYAPLKIVQAGNFDAASCQPKQADAILVYPPDQRSSLSIANDDYQGCANKATSVLTVQPVRKQ